MSTPPLPEHLAATMVRIYQERLTTPSGGNLSVRDGAGGLWVTPSQIDKGCLTAADMVRIHQDGTPEGSHKPTSEWPFHQAILAARPDCEAVVHAHSVGLVAFSVTGQALPVEAFPDLSQRVGRVAFSPYAIPGSGKLGDVLGRTFGTGCDATLMENHGAVAAGRTLLEAFFRFEAMERLAAIHLGAARLGLARPPAAAELDRARRERLAPWAALEKEASPGEAARRTELAEYVRRAHRRGLLGAQAGAFSMRCGQGFLVTPEDLDKAHLTGAELVYVESGLAQAGHVPDPLARLHEALYQAHPHVGALATALPPALMAFAASDRPFDARTIPEAYIFLKTVQTLPFVARLEPALVVKALAPRTPMALIAHACAVVTGADPFTVFDRLEVAECTARSILASVALGPLKPMPEEVLEEICRVYGV